MRVQITKHAAERFVERVRPALTTAAATREMLALARTGQLADHPPAWCEHADRGEHTLFLLLGDDVCLPVLKVGGRLTATTCLTAGTLPPSVRRARNLRRADRTRRVSFKPHRRDGRPDLEDAA